MQPTSEQIKRSWEWYGFYIERDANYPTLYEELFTPDKKHVMSAVKILACHYPPIDLNNLFKYAVPKVIAIGYTIHICCNSNGDPIRYIAEFSRWGNEERYCETSNKDPALALFWAIWKIIDEDNISSRQVKAGT